jgi:hypothetical protein
MRKDSLWHSTIFNSWAPAIARAFSTMTSCLISPARRESEAFFGSDGFGFDDFLDLINPLQHIPIISTIYREITGDTISQGARILGGAIFGGPLGFAAALGNAVVKQVADKDVGELALSLFDSDAPESEIRSAAFTRHQWQAIPGPRYWREFLPLPAQRQRHR